MDEHPSSPEDGLEGVLRRALSEAVGGVEPGTDGLGDIRARIGSRPPRPWLLAAASGAAERVRFWTWRGHWAWPGLPHAPGHLPWQSTRPRHRKGEPPREPRRSGDVFPRTAVGRRRAGLLWLAGALAGIAVIACVSMSVQPVRQAIIQASTTVFNGSGEPQAGGAGTDGSGARATTDGSGAAAVGATGTAWPGQPGSSGPADGAGGATPGPMSPSRCQPPATGAPRPAPTRSAATPAATAPETCAVNPSPTATASDTSPEAAGASATPTDAPAPWAADTPTDATEPTAADTPTDATEPTAADTSTDATAPTSASTPTPTPTSTAPDPGASQSASGQNGQGSQNGQGAKATKTPKATKTAKAS